METKGGEASILSPKLMIAFLLRFVIKFKELLRKIYSNIELLRHEHLI
jgi:hypothetical protein